MSPVPPNSDTAYTPVPQLVCPTVAEAHDACSRYCYVLWCSGLTDCERSPGVVLSGDSRRGSSVRDTVCGDVGFKASSVVYVTTIIHFQVSRLRKVFGLGKV